MEADKIITTITIETLSVDSVPALLTEIANRISNENVAGSLIKEDGDTVSWSQKTKHITF